MPRFCIWYHLVVQPVVFPAALLVMTTDWRSLLSNGGFTMSECNSLLASSHDGLSTEVEAANQKQLQP